MLENYQLELTAASSLHVGTGETYPAYAYIPDERAKKVHLLDTSRLLTLLEKHEQDTLIQAAEFPIKAQESLMRFWQLDSARLQPAVIRTILGSSAFFNTLRAAKNRGQTFQSQVRGAGRRPVGSQSAQEDLGEFEFRPLPVSLEGPYLPGSSVKGALRTAWLYAQTQAKIDTQDLVAQGDSWRFQSARDPEGGLIRGAQPGKMRQAQSFEAFLLGNLNPRNQRPDHYRDPFRALRIGDSGPFADTVVDRIGVFHPSKEMHVFVLAESFQRGTQLNLTLRFHRGLTERQGGKDPGVSQAVKPSALCEAAKEFYWQLLDMEQEYADKERLENASRLYSEMDARLKADPNLFPLRLGFGTGQFGNTLAFYLADAEGLVPEPLTRKTVGASDPRGGLPLGWVLARLTPR